MLRFVQTMCILICVCGRLLAVDVQRTNNHVVVDTVRFTVISPSLIRLEENSQKEFVDEPSLVAQNRSFGKADFELIRKDNIIKIRTNELLLTYNSDYNGFNPISLQISFQRGNQEAQWRFSTKNTGNLGGAVRDLNGVSGPIDLPDGLLSRSGWYLLDDSSTPILVDGWPEPRESLTAKDLYFFGYGLNYKQAIEDFHHLTGGLPLLPRWALGVWLLSDWPLTSEQLTELVQSVRANDIPVDSLVIHDWNKWGWTSFDWNKELFPNPETFLKNMQQRGIRVGLNMHPGGALQTKDTRYQQVTEIVGWDPKRRGMIFFDVSKRKQAQAMLKALLQPVEKTGADFWWVDGAAASTMRYLDALWWTNSLVFEGTRQNERPLILGYYGGLGSHKFPIQYLGTPEINWDVLGFLAHYVPTAGNVGVAYLGVPLGGRDIPMFGGGMEIQKPVSDDLLIRWLQLSALSPISIIQTEQGKIPWLNNSKMCRAANRYLRLRGALMPYLYTLAKIAQDQGLPLCRPIYLEYPEQEEAYQYPQQYLLGSDILVAPVVAAAPAPDAKALKTIWFPPGEWHELETNRIFRGPVVLNYPADLNTIPLFVRAGAVIPMYKRNASENRDTIVVNVHSGESGQFVMYMDDGTSPEYERKNHAVSIFSYAETEWSRVVRISEYLGKYPGMPRRRKYIIRLNTFLAPQSISVNGKTLPNRECKEDETGWYYVYDKAQVEACIGEFSTDKPIEVVAVGDFTPKSRKMIAEMRELTPRLESSALLLARNGGPQALVQQLRGIADRADKVARDITEEFTAQQADVLLQGLRGAVRKLVAEANKEITDNELKIAFVKELVGISVTNQIVPAVFRRIIVQSRIEFLPYGWGKIQGAVCIYKRPTEPFPVLQPGETAAFEETIGVNAIKLQKIIIPARTFVTWNGVKIDLQHDVVLDNSYLKQFYVLGPFGDGSFRKMSEVQYPWERKVELAAEYPGKRGRVITWHKHLWEAPVEDYRGEDYRFVDLSRMLERVPPSIGYATGYVFVPNNVTGVFQVGSAGGITLWVNDVEILREALMRVQRPNQVDVSVQLKQGWNIIRVKSVDEAARWGFYLRLVGTDGKPIPGAISGWGKGF